MFTTKLEDGTSTEWKPQQLHFHSPSEHTVNGKYYDAEMHLVHATLIDEKPAYAVLGIFFDKVEGGANENLFLKTVFDSFDDLDLLVNDEAKRQADQRKIMNSSLDLGNYWTYQGSFTTPPCSEGVTWTVLSQVQSISPTQLKRFQDALEPAALYTNSANVGNDKSINTKGNNREIQELNDRVIHRKEEKISEDSAESGLFVASATAIAAVASLLAF